MKKSKKHGIGFITLLRVAVDVLVVWQAYDLYMSQNKNLAIALIVIYLIIKIRYIIKAICRRKLKKEFNELFPE